MAEYKAAPLPHLIITGTSETEKYRSVSTGPRPKPLPPVDRATHGKALLDRVDTLKETAAIARKTQETAGMDAGYGLQIQFSGFPDVELAFESLARQRAGIELLNVKKEDTRTLATVFVPDGKLNVFEKLISEYLEEKKDKNGKPRDNKALLNTIEDVRAASFNSLWTDAPEALPESDEEEIWWEVWLPVLSDRKGTTDRFRRVAEAIGFRLAEGEVVFPERTVVMLYGTGTQFKQSGMLLNSVAEIRRAKETAEFFDALHPTEQRDQIDKLLEKATFPPETSPYVCLLDTGVNNGHPLIAPLLHDNDLHTVEVGEDPSDEYGHGTRMAGIALFGDLTHHLGSEHPMQISHRLESVKLLKHNGDNDGKHYGHLTIEAISRPEITAPERNRVFGMAVTTKDSRDRGRPSAWSATLDRLAADSDGDGLCPRLLVVSAGNIDDYNDWLNYPHSNSSDGIHDPGQAWNAITVGAYTDKITIEGDDTDGYVPIAPAGSLSPFSTTSLTWGRSSAFKPDVVFEGGNVAKDGDSAWACTMPSLNLLTTHNKPEARLLTTINATSAATAQCTKMAAEIMAAYPNLWPETVRALMVHSAEWTESMRTEFMTGGTPAEKYKRLIRHCGFGVPNLERAMWSATNSLTLIVEETLQPFEREKGKTPVTRDMHLHRLPWPLKELEALGETEVEMRVTLSYFIEPSPAERGISGRYRYESHGLRFDVIRPVESETEFRYRINRLVRDEEEGTPTSGSDHGWDLGPKVRHRGSLHSDIWRGQAVQLAQRGTLAVFPSLGWWKTRTALERYNKGARYALVVSIRAPEVDVDIYNVVRNMVGVPATVVV